MRRRGIGRVGRPSVVGTVARTAVVAGTASAVMNNSSQKREAQAQTQAELDAAVQQAVAAQTPAAPPPPPPAAAPAPAAAGPSMIDQLKELSALKDAGVLDEAEFAAAKANILAG
jgi:hypothetical protein